MRRLLPLTVTLLVLAPASAVAGPGAVPVTSMVTPPTLGGGSTLEVTAGPFASASTLPNALTLSLSTGFTTATNSAGTADSTVALCSSVEENEDQCPPESQIGSGSLTLTTDPPPPGDHDSTLTLDLSFFLGAPRVPNTVGQTGCTVPEAATVEVVSTLVRDSGDELVKWPDQLAATGDLCQYGRGLNLTQEFPAWGSALSGSAVTVDKLAVSLGPSATGTGGGTLAGNFMHNFLTNPDTCPGSNAWGTGLELLFPAETTSELPMDLSCGFLALGQTPGVGTLSWRLKTDKVSSPATFNANAYGPFLDPNGRPTLAAFTTQKGFSSSTMAVTGRCSAAEAVANACPAASRIGTGSALIGLVNSVTGDTTQTTVPLTIFLGRHLHGASTAVITVGSLVTPGQTETENAVGALSRVNGGVALNLTAIPGFTFPTGVIAEVDLLKLAVGQSRSVTRVEGRGHHRHRVTTTYSLIRTPSRCAGSWTVNATVSFPDEQLGPYPLGTSCTKPTTMRPTN